MIFQRFLMQCLTYLYYFIQYWNVIVSNKSEGLLNIQIKKLSDIYQNKT